MPGVLRTNPRHEAVRKKSETSWRCCSQHNWQTRRPCFYLPIQINMALLST